MKTSPKLSSTLGTSGRNAEQQLLMLRRRPGSLADANSLGPPACRTPLWLGRQDAAEVASADATEGKLVAIGTRSIAPMSAGQRSPATTRSGPPS